MEILDSSWTMHSPLCNAGPCMVCAVQTLGSDNGCKKNVDIREHEGTRGIKTRNRP